MTMANDPFDLNRLPVPYLRKSIFREHARQLMSERTRGLHLDTPGEIANLMERAYKAGMQLGSNPAVALGSSKALRTIEKVQPPQTGQVILTDAALPALAKRELSHFNLAVGCDRDHVRRWDANPEGLVLIMRPAIPGLPTTKSRDQWFYINSGGSFGWSNKVIVPLVRLGLYETPRDLRHGWKVTYMTEWGFEFFSTGSTVPLENRTPGASGTYDRFASVAVGDRRELFLTVAKKMGFLKEDATSLKAEASSPVPSLSPM
jgi:hypothetical protein